MRVIPRYWQEVSNPVSHEGFIVPYSFTWIAYMTNGGPICLLLLLLLVLFFFFLAKICMCFPYFGLDSILIHEIYFYFSYNPHKIYKRHTLFFFFFYKKKGNT